MEFNKPESNFKKDDSNQKLWKLYLEGNRDAFSQIFLNYYEKMYRYGVNLISDDELVKDGIQKLFYRLWKNRSSISEVKSVKFYLLISLRRVLFRLQDQHASQNDRNITYVEQFLDDDGFPGPKDQIIEKELQEEKSNKLGKALTKLTNRQHQVLDLRLNYGLKNKEIADYIGITHQRVRCIVSEAIARLKDEMNFFEGDQ